MSGRIYSDKPAQIRYSDKDEDNTEKRFNFKDTVDDEVFLKKRICDDYTNKAHDGTLKDQEDLCKLLNELDTKNQELKKQVILFKTRKKDVEDLIIKNSVLKKENTNLQVELLSQSEEIEILSEKNNELQDYKRAVSDVLLGWSQKSLTAKQLQVVIAIMEELNVKG